MKPQRQVVTRTLPRGRRPILPRDGLLKLLVSIEDRRILGVHVLGTAATDLVHIGQAVMASGAGGLDFLVTAVFNYPTFAESYKVAALDAANRIRAIS